LEASICCQEKDAQLIWNTQAATITESKGQSWGGGAEGGKKPLPTLKQRLSGVPENCRITRFHPASNLLEKEEITVGKEGKGL